MSNAHATALVIDRRHYVTCISNALMSMRYTRAHKRFYLHTVAASYMLDAASAQCVYAATVRHVVRIATNSNSMRSSVYTLRSDIRTIIRTNECAKFAH